MKYAMVVIQGTNPYLLGISFGFYRRKTKRPTQTNTILGVKLCTTSFQMDWLPFKSF